MGPVGGGFGGGGFNPGGGGGGNWPGGGGFQPTPANMARAQFAKKNYLKEYRMTFVQARSDFDQLSFMFMPIGVLINEIHAVTGCLVEVGDIMTQRNINRHMFQNQGFSKQELTGAFKARRNGF